MRIRMNVLRDLIFGHCGGPAERVRRPRRAILTCDSLEGRVTPAHGGFHHAIALAHLHAGSGSTASSISSSATYSNRSGSTTSGSSSSGSSSNSALTTALQTLRNDVQTIELASGTTVGELTAIRVDFQALANDGLSPSSHSALSTFEDSLVKAKVNGTSLTDGTLLSQFEALYSTDTSSLSTQQTQDLTSAYNALVAAVTSSNITSANIKTIDTDWAAVLAAENSTSTATYPYFNLVTGGGSGGCGGVGVGGGPGGGGGFGRKF